MILAIALGGLINFVVFVVIALLLLWLFSYLINNLAPEPMRKILNIVLMVVFVIVICILLLGLVSGSSTLKDLHL